jgi:hypothetical protein
MGGEYNAVGFVMARSQYGWRASAWRTVSFSKSPKWDKEGCAMSRKLSNFEERLMRGLGLNNVRQLDKLLAAPISQDVADHSGPPDEAYELQEKAEEYLDLLHRMRERFEALSESKYIN